MLTMLTLHKCTLDLLRVSFKKPASSIYQMYTEALQYAKSYGNTVSLSLL